MESSRSKSSWGIVCGIAALILLCYWQVWQFEFINYDDLDYVPQNPAIQNGFTGDALNWAFTTGHVSNWHPLTWLSHILDWQIYGPRAGGHHFTNVLFHLANSLILFVLLNRMTGKMWRCAMVAALFAFHPLHVESVAWVSERKDVLSVFFGLISLWYYTSYVRQVSEGRSHKLNSGFGHRPFMFYGAAVLFFAFSLMSKPMLVTAPFLLLLLDVWPLQRRAGMGGVSISRLLLEKIPFLLLTIGSCIITIHMQAGKTIQSLNDFGVTDRISNALVSYAAYLAQTFWPVDLAFFYPLLGAPPVWKWIGALVIFLLISTFAVIRRTKAPALLIGWLWYVGTLVPVIGLVHVGEQSMADRYTYFPLIGVFIALVWWIADWRSSNRSSGDQSALLRRPLIAAAAMLVIVLAFLSHRQIGFWRDSKTVLTRALAVTQNNFLAHNNYGVVLADAGNYEEAIKHYREAITIKPHYARAYSNLGASLALSGHFQDAITNLEKALSLRPNDAETHHNLAVTLAQLQNYHGTIEHCRAALAVNPNYKVAHYDLALALSLTGDNNKAVEHIRKYLQAFPNDEAANKLLSQTISKATTPQ